MAFALCVLVALACRGSHDPVTPAERYGFYRLESRNGQAPPVDVNVVHGDVAVTSITGGRVELLQDGTHATVIFITGTKVAGAPVNEIVLSESHPVTYGGDRATLPVTGGVTLMGTFSGEGFATRLTVPFPTGWGTLIFVRSIPGCRDLCS